MNLLGRFFRFLVVSAFRLALGLLTVLVRFVVLPLLLATLRMLRRLVWTSLTATVTGPGQYTERLASEWTRRLLALGIPRDNIDQLYNLCRLLAASQILLGWAIAALITLAILRIVFELFI